MTFNDDIFGQLGDLGYEGTLNDRWFKFLVDQSLSGTFNDMLYKYLLGKGYTGVLGDMLMKAYYADDLFVTLPPSFSGPIPAIDLIVDEPVPQTDFRSYFSGTITNYVVLGTLPPGVYLVGSRLVGTPTTINTHAGISIRAEGPLGNATSNTFTIDVIADPNTVAFTGNIADMAFALDEAITPVDVSGNFTGNITSYQIVPSIAGLSVSTAGVISGTPTVEAVTPVVVRASGTGTADSNSFNIAVSGITNLITFPEFDPATGKLNQHGYTNEQVSTVNVPDHEGIYRAIHSGSLIYEGARVVTNKLTTNTLSGSANFNGWSGIGDAVIDSDTQFTVGGGTSNRIQISLNANLFHKTYRFRAKGAVGGEELHIWDGWGVNAKITLTTEWETYSVNGAHTSTGHTTYWMMYLKYAGTVQVDTKQIQDKTGSSNPTIPDEFTDSIALYNTENNFTVDPETGIVTDNGVGALLNPQPVGPLHVPEATNYAPLSDDITGWTHRGPVSTNYNGDYTEVRGLSTHNVADLYTSYTAGAVDSRVEPCLLLRSLSPSGTLILGNARSEARGEWRIDLSQVSATQFDHITRDHPAVTIVTEFRTDPLNSNTGAHLKTLSGTADIDVKGITYVDGIYPTYPITTAGAPVTRDISKIQHPFSGLSESAGTAMIKFRPRYDQPDPRVAGKIVSTDELARIIYCNANVHYVYSYDRTSSKSVGSAQLDEISGADVIIAVSFDAAGEFGVSMKQSVWQHGARGAYDGDFSIAPASILKLFDGWTYPVEILDVEWLNTPLTATEIEARYP